MINGKTMSPRKVVVDARFLTQPLTGVQRYAIELSLRLKQMDPSIRFVCPKDVIQRDIFERLEAKIIGSHTRFLWSQIDLPMYLKKHNNPLLVNFDSVSASAYYRNKIVTLHDITWARYPQSFSRRVRMLHHVIDPIVLKNSLEIITVSNFSKKEIVNYFKNLHKAPHVIYNAVDDKFHINDKERSNILAPYILAVASQVYHKNITKLIEAFDKICKHKKSDFSLIIAGGSDDCFQKQSYKIRSDASIRFTGRVTDEELVKLYQEAAVLVFPSLYEGFGIPPLEAQACGCPVVASNVASMPEILGDSVLYFDPNNIAEIQDVIYQVIGYPSLRESLIEKGYANVSRFSWDTSVRQLYDILVNISNTPSSHY
jgi:glycosyltransferase involved in cell wall biosynthesis